MYEHRRSISPMALAALGLSLLWGLSGIAQTAARALAAEKEPHIVFVIGEAEYHSEKTMPAFAKELKKKYGLRSTVLLADPDPSNRKNIPGLEALDSADLAVFYVRFRELPKQQLDRILDYVNAGKPVVALRTTTHAFRYPESSELSKWNDGFGQNVLGAPWRYHYGHSSSTDVSVVPETADHPILKGVDKEFHCRSWLYHVLPIADGTEPLLVGKSVGPGRGHVEERVVNPVAWTYSHNGGRVFYTSLGHPEDFQVAPFRRLLTNAVFWALDRPVPTAEGTTALPDNQSHGWHALTRSG